MLHHLNSVLKCCREISNHGNTIIGLPFTIIALIMIELPKAIWHRSCSGFLSKLIELSLHDLPVAIWQFIVSVASVIMFIGFVAADLILYILTIRDNQALWFRLQPIESESQSQPRPSGPERGT